MAGGGVVIVLQPLVHPVRIRMSVASHGMGLLVTIAEKMQSAQPIILEKKNALAQKNFQQETRYPHATYHNTYKEMLPNLVALKDTKKSQMPRNVNQRPSTLVWCIAEIETPIMMIAYVTFAVVVPILKEAKVPE